MNECFFYVPWSSLESMNSRKKGSSEYQSNPPLHRWITFLSSCLNEIITTKMQETGLALKSTASKPMKTLKISQLWDNFLCILYAGLAIRMYCSEQCLTAVRYQPCVQNLTCIAERIQCYRYGANR